MKSETTKQASDRRRKFRFAIHRDLRYKLLDDGVIIGSGVGQTDNMGSGGVSFTIDRELKPGAYIELSISWPVLLDNTCPMRFIAFGRVLRSEGEQTACTIDKYEFRTAARTVQSAAPVRNDSMLQRWADTMRKESLRPRTVSVAAAATAAATASASA